jgi:hypothetical protein
MMKLLLAFFFPPRVPGVCHICGDPCRDGRSAHDACALEMQAW